MKRVFYNYQDSNKYIVLNKYIPLTIEEAIDVLQTDDIDNFIAYFTDPSMMHVIYCISKEKIPRIFVLKRNTDSRDDRHSNEKMALRKAQTLSDRCQKVLNIGRVENVADSDVIVMEYFDGNLIDIVTDLYEDERREILGKVVLAVECLASKNLAYTDLKLGQVLFRQKEDKFYDIKLTDFEVTRFNQQSNDDIMMTYDIPEKYYRRKHFDPHIDLFVVWGLFVFTLSLWTFSSSRIGKNVVKFLRKPRKLFKYLERVSLPLDVREFLEYTYDNLEFITMDEMFESLEELSKA